MEAITKEYLAEVYEVVKVLKKTERTEVYLVSNKMDNCFYILKKVKLTGLPYRELQKITTCILPHIYQVWEDERETITLEEYINGKDLATLATEKQFAPKEVLEIFLQLCQGLAQIHAQKIIHRDIKPSNLLLMADGTLKLIDFDAARLGKVEASTDTKLLGTEGYAPPEQYGFAQTDERSDIYAMGRTLELLLGKSPSREWQKIIAKATALDPKQRYQKVDELQKALVQIEQVGTRKALVAAILSILVLCLSWYGYGYYQTTQQANTLPKEQVTDKLPEPNQKEQPQNLVVEKLAPPVPQTEVAVEEGNLASQTAPEAVQKQKPQAKPVDEYEGMDYEFKVLEYSFGDGVWHKAQENIGNNYEYSRLLTEKDSYNFRGNKAQFPEFYYLKEPVRLQLHFVNKNKIVWLKPSAYIAPSGLYGECEIMGEGTWEITHNGWEKSYQYIHWELGRDLAPGEMGELEIVFRNVVFREKNIMLFLAHNYSRYYEGSKEIGSGDIPLTLD